MQGLAKDLAGRDGFRASLDEPDADYLVFREHLGGDKGILFIHGAIHLYEKNGEVRKHSWSRNKLQKTIVELVKDGLEKKQYPLFVAEGLAEKKLEQIQHSGYLSYCLGKLERIEQALVIFGLALGDSDQHICKTIANNKKLKTLYVGLFEPKGAPSSQAIARSCKWIQERRKDIYGFGLEVKFYDSKSACVWD